MSKRATGLGKGKGRKPHSPKTKKRLEIKWAMLASRKKKK